MSTDWALDLQVVAFSLVGSPDSIVYVKFDFCLAVVAIASEDFELRRYALFEDFDSHGGLVTVDTELGEHLR